MTKEQTRSNLRFFNGNFPPLMLEMFFFFFKLSNQRQSVNHDNVKLLHPANKQTNNNSFTTTTTFVTTTTIPAAATTTSPSTSTSQNNGRSSNSGNNNHYYCNDRNSNDHLSRLSLSFVTLLTFVSLSYHTLEHPLYNFPPTTLLTNSTWQSVVEQLECLASSMTQ